MFYYYNIGMKLIHIGVQHLELAGLLIFPTYEIRLKKNNKKAFSKTEQGFKCKLKIQLGKRYKKFLLHM